MAPGGCGGLAAERPDDPRFLAEVRLLAALHADLRGRLAPAEATRTLLQTGFVHGLRDALATRTAAPVGDDEERAAAACPVVAMHLAAGPAGGLRGSWPGRVEADAVLLAVGRRDAPACLVSAGYTSGWISGLWEADVLAVETRCAARGDPACCFEARDAAFWARSGERAARALLDALPFAALRAEVMRALPAPAAASGAGVDPGSPAVHIWGPVMVVPYAGDETAVAVERVAREPSAAGVTVVVVDLQGAIVDDGFGAIALERVVETIEGHGAEAVFAGLSPLSQAVVSGLGREALVVRKDLRSAIATAFQIAESQRHLL